MDEKKVVKPHSVKLDNRSDGSITGVTKLIASYPAEINLETECGGIIIGGADLKLERYDEADGVLSFSGTINSIKYCGAKVPLLKRLFK